MYRDRCGGRAEVVGGRAWGLKDLNGPEKPTSDRSGCAHTIIIIPSRVCILCKCDFLVSPNDEENMWLENSGEFYGTLSGRMKEVLGGRVEYTTRLCIKHDDKFTTFAFGSTAVSDPPPSPTTTHPSHTYTHSYCNTAAVAVLPLPSRPTLGFCLRRRTNPAHESEHCV